MRIRALVLLVALVLVPACGDDGEQASSTSDESSVPTVIGPTDPYPCARLARRYVRTARALFDREGAASDAEIEAARARMAQLDAEALTTACGETYTSAVCEGLDALTHEGILVIIPLTTAQCL